MLYGICNISIVPLRLEESDKSEMISQVLFGEHFEIIEKQKKADNTQKVERKKQQNLKLNINRH